jgi:release factor glutamine methyltransferase
MTIKECVKKYARQLKDITHIPQKEVEILLLHILKKNVIWLHLHYNDVFEQEIELSALVSKRASNYPLEYIIQKASFYGETFVVKPNVLIPRPETELLVEKAYEILKEIKKPTLLEIGVGSGIISVSLAKMLPNLSIIAADINEDALGLAKENASKHEVQEQIEFRHSDLLNNIQENTFDMCISNPPYIANDYDLPKDVQYEPLNALCAGPIGDELLKELIRQVHNKDINYLLCEMGYDQQKALKEYFLDFEPNALTFYKDYENFDRGFVAKLKNTRRKNV